MLVEGPIQKAPLALDAHIGLIDADQAAMRFAETPQPFLHQGSVGQNPPVDGAVIDFKAMFQEHFFQVMMAQQITQVAGDCLDDQPGLALSAFEVILRLAFQLFYDGTQNHDAELQILERPFNSQISRRG